MKKLVLLFAFSVLKLCAQPFPPDCFMSILNSSITAVSANFDNRDIRCVDWTVTVNFQGFATASVELDSAPDANGTPGTFTAFSGTVLLGTNPVSSFTQNSATILLNGYVPWLKLNFSSKTGTGTLTVMAFGSRPSPFTIFKSTTQAVNVNQLGGSNVFPCLSQATFNFSVSGNAQIIPASGSNRTLICHYDVSFASGVDFKLTTGTGANCAVGGADITGLKKNILTDSQDYGPFSPLVGAASQAVCGNSSANVAGGLTIIYTQQP